MKLVKFITHYERLLFSSTEGSVSSEKGAGQGRVREKNISGEKKKGVASVLIYIPDLEVCYCGFLPTSFLKSELLTMIGQQQKKTTPKNPKQNQICVLSGGCQILNFHMNANFPPHFFI